MEGCIAAMRANQSRQMHDARVRRWIRFLVGAEVAFATPARMEINSGGWHRLERSERLPLVDPRASRRARKSMRARVDRLSPRRNRRVDLRAKAFALLGPIAFRSSRGPPLVNRSVQCSAFVRSRSGPTSL